MRVLLVAGEDAFVSRLAGKLRSAGHGLEWWADSHNIGQPMIRACDVLLVEACLPVDFGAERIRTLRSAAPATPILVMTAAALAADRRQWLEAGADDCLVKPFGEAALIDRLQRLASRSNAPPTPPLRCGDVELHLPTGTALRGGEPVNLTPREWQLVETLATQCDRIVPRVELEQVVYGPDSELASNALEVHLSSVRRKLGRHLIRTVRGVGYVLKTG